MTSNSQSVDQAHSDTDGNCITRFKKNTCLRLRLVRVLSSGGLKSPKSPKSVSSSRDSSPGHSSPRSRKRYSWQSGSYSSEENRSPRSPESGISTLSSSRSSSSRSSSTVNTSSPKSPLIPKNPYSSIWYAVGKNHRATGRCSAGAAECATTKTSYPTTNSALPSKRSRRRRGARRRGGLLLFSPLLSPFIVCSLLSWCTSSPCSAERYAPRSKHHCGTSSRVKASQNLGNRRVRTSLYGGPVVKVKHESIRHEVLTAAAATTAEAEKVGE